MNLIQEDIKRIKSLMNLLENDDDIESVFKQKYTGQSGAHDEDDMASDGMDDDSDTNEKVIENEIYEDEEATDTTTDTKSDTGATVKSWESGVQRGPGNPVGSAKREDKVSRGPGNPVGNTKWEWKGTVGRGNPRN